MGHYQKHILNNGTQVELFINRDFPAFITVFGEAFGNKHCEIGDFMVFDRYKTDDDSDTKKCIHIFNECVFLEDFIAYSPEEWNEKIANGEQLTESDLVCTILKYGVDNVKFTMPLKYFTSFIPEELKNEPIVCKFNPDFRYGISTYKLGFRGVYQNKEMREPFECENDTYTSDLASSFQRGFCKFVK